MRTYLRPIGALAAVLLLSLVPAPAVGAGDEEPWPADYYGKTINLNEGWGDAQACFYDGDTTTCFDTEEEMDEWLGEEATASLTSCSSSLRLYDFTSYGTPVLATSVQGVWVNLGSFDNRTSSYKVGACDALFAAGANGTGGFYPGSTLAGVQSPSMSAGWDNVVSSVYIY